MPPVNSPLLPATHPASALAQQSHLAPPAPPRTPSPSTFLSETAPTLSSPVLDLASTLTIQAEDDVDHDNVDFLRRPVEEELSAESLTREINSERRRMSRIEAELRDRSWAQVQGRSRERTMADLRSLSEQEARERRLHTRRMAELRTAMDRRWNHPMDRPGLANPAPPYTGADNASNSLYDWAPPSHEDTGEEQLEATVQDLRLQQPNTHPDVLVVLARAQLDADRDYRQRNGQPPSQPHEPSLRSAAILQSVRRHRIGQAAAYSRQRELIQRYNSARSELVRQYAADTQDSSATPQDATEATARDQRTQRVEDLLTISDALRLDYQGESTRSNRYPEPAPGQSSILRNIRLHREARDASTPEPFVYSGQRLPSGQEGRQSTDSPSAHQPADMLDDLRRLYLNNPRSNPTRLDLQPMELHMEAFKSTIEIHRKLQDGDDQGLFAMLREFDSVPSLRELAHGLDKQLLGLRDLRHADALVAPTSYLQAGTQFIGSQSSSQTSPARNSSSSSSHIHRPPSTYEPPAAASGLAGPTRLTNQPLPSNRVWLREDSGDASQRFSASPNTMSRVPSAGHAPLKHPERWTVKVSVHSVDYETMTLQGTMEAFDVPSLTQSLSSSSHIRPDPLASVNPANSSDPSSPANTYQTLDPHHARTAQPQFCRTTFSTFVEGQIIDFKENSLLTPSSTFSATASESSTKAKAAATKISHFDALYWRKLEPFASLSDHQLASALLDSKWIKEELLSKYVLMRWKERCFVSPTTLSTTALRCPPATPTTPADCAPETVPQPVSATSPATLTPTVNGYGLSISGFYYVSLRRSDGRCTGLYYDPQSSPYQHLEMRVAMAGASADPLCAAKTAPSTAQAAEHAPSAGLDSANPGHADMQDKTRHGGLWAVGSWSFR